MAKRKTVNKCIICSGDKFRGIVNSKMLIVEECIDCGLYRVPAAKKNPDVGKYFENYDLDKYVAYYEGFRKKIYRNNWKEIKKIIPSGNLLDFGSSFGWFLEVAPKKWRSYGIEPAEVADLSARKGFNVIRGTEKDIAKFKTNFDAITMWNVIEHLSEPIKTLEYLTKYMNQKSVFAIAFPNRYGFFNQLAFVLYRMSFGKFVKPLHTLYQADNPVPHLFHYRIRDIEKILEKIGFEVLKNEPQKIVDAKKLWIRQEVQDSPLLKFVGIPVLVSIDCFLDKIRYNRDEIVIYARRKKL